MSPVKQYEGWTIEDLRTQLSKETDSNNIKEITTILNAHLQKKDIIRKSQLSDLQDRVQEQMEKRITERGDCFSNKDLLDYLKVIDDTVNKIGEVEIKPTQIKVTNQQLNINLDKPQMSREEKTQVVDAVKAILQRVQSEQLGNNIENNTIIEAEYTETNDK